MSTVTKPILLDETGEEIVDELHKIALALGGEISVSTWKEIATVTRAGKAKQALKVGQEFTVPNINATAVVMGFIEDGENGSLKLHDSNLENGVIFQFKDCLYNLQFDEKEAFYYTPTALSAGAYSFVLGQHSWVSGDVGKTFYFTLTNALPAGGQLVFQQGYSATLEGASIKSYSGGSSNTAIETATMSSTAISGATSLGTLNNTFSGNFNSCQRALLGNGRWKESAIRQQLNSASVAGSVWTPQNNWDRQPSWHSSKAGLLNGVDADSFLNFVAEIDLSTYKNTVCDGGGLDVTTDRFFLAGRNEVWMTQEGADNGVAWDYYKEGSTFTSAHDTADAIRIKSLNSSATYWWLRSPSVGYAHGVCYVSPTGAYSDHIANRSYGVAPAFVIA